MEAPKITQAVSVALSLLILPVLVVVVLLVTPETGAQEASQQVAQDQPLLQVEAAVVVAHTAVHQQVVAEVASACLVKGPAVLGALQTLLTEQPRVLTAVAAAPVGLREPKVALRIIRKVVQAASTGAAQAVMAVTQAVAPILRTMALKVRSLS